MTLEDLSEQTGANRIGRSNRVGKMVRSVRTKIELADQSKTNRANIADLIYLVKIIDLTEPSTACSIVHADMSKLSGAGRPFAEADGFI